MRSIKMVDGCKGTQVFAINPTDGGGGGVGGSVGEKFFQHLQDHLRVNSIRSKSHRRYQSFSQINNVNPNALAEALSIYGLPNTDLIEPQIDPSLKFIDFVGTLAELYNKLENCSELEKSGVYMEQCAIFRGSPDPKLFRRCLRSARQHAVDVHSKVVLSAWLRFERREDELFGVSSMDCCGWKMECPKSSLVAGYSPESANDPCSCTRGSLESEVEDQECSTSDGYGDGLEDDYDMWFCIGDEEIKCNRYFFAVFHLS
ncbi:hypothetical protein RD792_013901 [Penstemon davidsonii]|uniref:Uncharacterized protein n=1 Tax=Penstemon davidsonii TaxID=160366 RepID=A0ABR0CND6_9LAMI|nr:hypothetical protein RD792_013901 [Penstemon davidsonii]